VAGTRFLKGASIGQQFVAITIREYASSSAARQSWEAMTKVPGTCHHETYLGERMTYTAMSATKDGDASAGVQMGVDDATIGVMTVVRASPSSARPSSRRAPDA
jgi:hypothetical protein